MNELSVLIGGKAGFGIDRASLIVASLIGQLVKLMNQHGMSVKDMILKYDGRGFSVEELEERVRKVLG